MHAHPILSDVESVDVPKVLLEASMSPVIQRYHELCARLLSTAASSQGLLSLVTKIISRLLRERDIPPHTFHDNPEVPNFLSSILPAAWLEAHFIIATDADTPITDDNGPRWRLGCTKPAWSSPYRRPTWQMNLQLLSLCALTSSVDQIFEQFSPAPTPEIHAA